MTRYTVMTLALSVMFGSAGIASAQFPTQPYSGSPYQYSPNPNGPYNTPTVMPNIYNPANQPLSPYLNLLRGGNAGVNYYYGVRPGTVGGTGFGVGAPFTASGGNRTLFFPQLLNAPDPEQPTDAAPSVLPPAGHPTVFNNTLGFYPSPNGNRGSLRPGLSGVGNRAQQRR
jgi:hypothetical protein